MMLRAGAAHPEPCGARAGLPAKAVPRPGAQGVCDQRLWLR